MKKYASGTSVPIERSRVELDKLLTKYGATGTGTMVRSLEATVMFEMKHRTIKFRLVYPTILDCERNAAKLEQEKRRLWRALVMVVKAKLEAVESGISTLEREFLADVVLPNGQTVGERIAPDLASFYARGLPPLLPLKSGDGG